MTDTGDARLAELLCARLCHDLASPVGAVVAGAELLGDEEDGAGADAEALALLGGSAATAAARLKFFRAAFGPAAAALEESALRDLVAGMLGGGVTLSWRAEGRLDADRSRLLLNLALLGRDALPRGGSLTVESAQPSGRLVVTAQGPVADLGEAAAGLGTAAVSDLSPRGAQARLTALLARGIGGMVKLDSAVENGRQVLRLAVDGAD